MMTPETLTPREALLLEQIALLREQVRLLTEKLDLLERHNAALEQHNAVLRLKVDAMARKLFGRSSEKLDPAQLQMVFDALREEEDGTAKKAPASDCAACGSEAEAEAAAAPGAKRRKRTLEEVIAGLPTSEVIIDPPEVTARPEAWQCIGAEETRLIDYTPGKFSSEIIRLMFGEGLLWKSSHMDSKKPIRQHSKQMEVFMFRFVSIVLLCCSTLQLSAMIPPGGLAYEVEPLFQDPNPLKNVTAEQLSKLGIDDPLLRHAYGDLLASELMLQISTRSRNIDYSAYSSWNVAALEDIRKRGDAVTPVLLDIAAKNPNSGLETGVLGNAPYVIKDLNPYLEHARKILQTRTMEMNSSVAGTVAELLIRSGTPDDVEKIRNLLKVRPYLTGTLEAALRQAAVFQPTINDASDTRLKIIPPIEPPPTPKKDPEAKPTPGKPGDKPASSTPWHIIVVLMVAALGLPWLLLHRSK